jgi:DNA repair and recombination protein RAD54B
MYRRPFVSPLLKRPSPASDEDAGLEKRARLGMARQFVPPINKTGAVGEGTRTPLLNLQVPNYSPARASDGQEAYFNVLWRTQTTRKNKTWDGDGVLAQNEGMLTLRDMEGKKCNQWLFVANGVGWGQRRGRWGRLLWAI